MDFVFEIIDKTGRKIHLSKERWTHIRLKHPNVENSESIIDTILNSDKIVKIEEDIIAYYKYFKHRKEPLKYLNVIVKYLNGNGYVVTSYFVRNILL